MIRYAERGGREQFASQPQGTAHVSATHGPSAVVEPGDARDHRDEIIELFDRDGKPKFRMQFDWYYRDEGQETPFSWFLWNGQGQLCGLCSVSLRLLRFGVTTIRAGVAGNLLVDRESRLYYGASSLIRGIKSLVVDRAVDILLGIPNQVAQPVFFRSGFRTIGRWNTQAQLFRSSTLLRSRIGLAGALASPFTDLLAASRRAISQWPDFDPSGFKTVELTENELSKLASFYWPPLEGYFTFHSTDCYIKWRFLRNPTNQFAVFGIQSPKCNLCAYLVTRLAAGRMWIVDCGVDTRHISEEAAVLCFCRSQRAKSSTVWITSLRWAPLGAPLAASGFIPIPPSLGGYSDYPLVGFWRQDHPLAHEFGQVARWNLFPGFNDV